MLTLGQISLAILTALLALVVLPVMLLALAGTWTVDMYEHHSFKARRRTRLIAQPAG